MSIHPTAIIDRSAELGENVTVGPYSIVEADVVVGPGSVLEDHVKICKGSKIGQNCSLHPFTVIGGDPQYIGFDSSLASGVLIGNGCVIREHATIHRSIYEGKNTILGNEVYLMVASHVAHDCELEDNVILTNAALLGGHVHVGKSAYLGGGAAVHQFVRIGEGTMTAGHASITMDVAPFLMVGERDRLVGLNSVGLKRRGVSRESIRALKELFQELFKAPGNIRGKASEKITELGDDASIEVRTFLEFFEGGKRGFCGVRKKSENDSE